MSRQKPDFPPSSDPDDELQETRKMHEDQEKLLEESNADLKRGDDLIAEKSEQLNDEPTEDNLETGESQSEAEKEKVKERIVGIYEKLITFLENRITEFETKKNKEAEEFFKDALAAIEENLLAQKELLSPEVTLEDLVSIQKDLDENFKKSLQLFEAEAGRLRYESPATEATREVIGASFEKSELGKEFENKKKILLENIKNLEQSNPDGARIFKEQYSSKVKEILDLNYEARILLDSNRSQDATLLIQEAMKNINILIIVSDQLKDKISETIKKSSPKEDEYYFPPSPPMDLGEKKEISPIDQLKRELIHKKRDYALAELYINMWGGRFGKNQATKDKSIRRKYLNENVRKKESLEKGIKELEKIIVTLEVDDEAKKRAAQELVDQEVVASAVPESTVAVNDNQQSNPIQERIILKQDSVGELDDAQGVKTSEELARKLETIEKEKEKLEKTSREEAKQYFKKKDNRPTFDKDNGGKKALIDEVERVYTYVEAMKSFEEKDLTKDQLRDVKLHRYIEKAWKNFSNKEKFAEKSQRNVDDERVKYDFAAFLAKERFRKIKGVINDELESGGKKIVDIKFEDLEAEDKKFKEFYLKGTGPVDSGKRKSIEKNPDGDFEFTIDGGILRSNASTKSEKGETKQRNVKLEKSEDGKYKVTGGTKEENNKVARTISEIRKEHMDSLKKGEDYNIVFEMYRLPENLQRDVSNILTKDREKLEEARAKKAKKIKKPKKSAADQDKLDLENLSEELGVLLDDAGKQLEQQHAERKAKQEKQAWKESFVGRTVQEVKDFGKDHSPSAYVEGVKEGVEDVKESVPGSLGEAGQVVDKVKRIGEEYMPPVVAEPEVKDIGWPRWAGRIVLRPFRWALKMTLGAGAISSRAAVKMGQEGNMRTTEEAIDEAARKLGRRAESNRVNRQIDKVEDELRTNEERQANPEDFEGTHKYYYEGMDASGNEVVGNLNADSDEEAEKKIRKKGYFVTKIKELPGSGSWWKNLFGGSSKAEEIALYEEEFKAEMDRKDTKNLGDRIASEKPDSFDGLIGLIGPKSFYDKESRVYLIKKINAIKDALDKFEKKEVKEQEAKDIILREFNNIGIKVLVDKLREIIEKKVKTIKSNIN